MESELPAPDETMLRHRHRDTIVAAQEQERRRIALEIHDDTVQVMAAALFRMEVLKLRCVREQDADAVEDVAAAVRAAIARLRRLMVDLRPPELERGDLRGALRTLATRVRDRATDLAVHVDFTATAEPSSGTAATLFRVAQEALANVTKHAQATAVDLRMQDRADGILLTVRDNGVGASLDDLEMPAPGHFGLLGMRERADAAGGWCWVDATPGVGTTVCCWVPAEHQVMQVPDLRLA